jgi:hypothetical protein
MMWNQHSLEFYRNILGMVSCSEKIESILSCILNLFFLIFAEIPDITIPKQLDMLRNWNGELRLLQNFKLRRFNRKSLQDLMTCPEPNQEGLVADDYITVKSAVSVKAPIVQMKEFYPQNDGKSDVNEAPVSLESKTQDITDDVSMDVSNK